jgi:hypothetical protein
MKIDFSPQIPEKIEYQIEAAALFHAGGRTDRHT